MAEQIGEWRPTITVVFEVTEAGRVYRGRIARRLGPGLQWEWRRCEHEHLSYQGARDCAARMAEAERDPGR